MRTRIELTQHMLEHAYQEMMRNIEAVTLEEALFVPAGGYRSILGTLKHAAGWSRVYWSYAFQETPRHWKDTNWPFGLRDTVQKSKAYLDAVIAWFTDSHQRWMESLSPLDDEELDRLHRVHWGEQRPLYDIVVLIAHHHVYHAGELNQVLSICRGEAWEEGEEVEDNNISTLGHRVIPPWKQ
jgi:hypothetical protein